MKYLQKLWKKGFVISFLMLLLFSCKEKSQQLYSYISPQLMRDQFISLNLDIQMPEINRFSAIETLYVLGKYNLIVQGKNFSPDSLSVKEAYVYFQTCSHLKEWKLIESKIQNQRFLKDELLGSSFVLLYLESQIRLEHFSEALHIVNQYRQIIQGYEPAHFAHQLMDELAARLHNPSLAHSQGGYYYYLFVQDRKNFHYYKKALSEYNPEALSLLQPNRFYQYVNSHDVRILEWSQLNYPALYISMLKYNHSYQEIASYYFHKEKYNKVLSFVKEGYYFNMSCLMLNRKVSKSVIHFAQMHLPESGFYLATYFYNKNDYFHLNQVALKSNASGVLRMLIVLGLNKKEYLNLTNALITKLQTQNLSLLEKTMIYYWLGYLYQKRGNTDQAAAYYSYIASKNPYTYYGWEALKSLDKEQIKKTFSHWAQIYQNTKERIYPYISELNQANLSHSLLLKKAFYFFHIREDQKALLYLKEFFPTINKKEKYYLALSKQFYAENRMDYSISYARLIYNHIDQITESHLFYSDLLFLNLPLLYKNFIIESAQYFHIPANAFSSLILQESNYDFKAISWAGAQGLSQLMPSTAANILKNLYSKGVTYNKDIFDPRTNIMVGGSYFSWLYRKVFKNYPEEDRFALTYGAYNAGAKRIKKIYQQINKENISHFIESIYLTETRNYIKTLRLKQDLYSFLYQF